MTYRMENKEWKNIVKKTTIDVSHCFDDIILSFDFGAYIAPEDYFAAYVFKTDETLENAKKSGLLQEINKLHKSKMIENGYPEESVKDCVFASQEDCDRHFNGNWYYYFK